MPSAFLHPFGDPADQEEGYINLVRAEGSTIWDDKGNSYIDGLASLFYCQVGHGRQDMIDAITDQLNKFVVYNTFPPFANDVAARAADAVARVSPMPDGRVFFGSSGSEAVDTALKMARRVQQVRGRTDKQIIVKRTRGYHGTNFGGTSAQGIEANREGWGDLVPHFIEVPADDIEAVSLVFAEHGPNIAAMLTEPVQGAFGIFPPPEGYLAGLRRLCDDHDALLIFDEVINGFGRTGEWFAAQYYGVTPDLMTFAKGVTSGYMPVSGVLMSKAVNDELAGAMLRTGYTYSGHPSCMAAVIKNIEIIEEEDLLGRAKHMETRFRAGLDALQADGVIEYYEGVGGMWGVETGRDDNVAVRDRMLELGVVVRPVYSRLAICPPLVITDEEIGHIIDSMAMALAEVPAS